MGAYPWDESSVRLFQFMPGFFKQLSILLYSIALVVVLLHPFGHITWDIQLVFLSVFGGMVYGADAQRARGAG